MLPYNDFDALDLEKRPLFITSHKVGSSGLINRSPFSVWKPGTRYITNNTNSLILNRYNNIKEEDRNKEISGFNKIFIIRNPYERFISTCYFFRQQNHLSFDNLDDFIDRIAQAPDLVQRHMDAQVDSFSIFIKHHKIDLIINLDRLNDFHQLYGHQYAKYGCRNQEWYDKTVTEKVKNYVDVVYQRDLRFFNLLESSTHIEEDS